MTDIKVTKADKEAGMALLGESWIDRPIDDVFANAFAGHRIEAQRPLLEALEKAEKTFRWYGDLHAAKPDAEKAACNYELADEMGAAIKQAKGEGA